MPPDLITDDSQEIFSDAAVRQAARNIESVVGLGIDDVDSEVPVKTVLEASREILNRKYGKPRETVELSHKIALRIDVPGWGGLLPTPAPVKVIDAVLGGQEVLESEA